MDQNQIQKLQELKKLVEAGILTQDEMISEKAKILGTAKNQSKAEKYDVVTEDSNMEYNESNESDIEESNTVPDDNNIADKYNVEEETIIDNREESFNGEESKAKFRNLIFVVAGVAVILLLSMVLLTKKPSGGSSENIESTMTIEDKTSGDRLSQLNTTDKEVIETTEVTTVDEEVSNTTKADEEQQIFDPWSGILKIEGDVYRTCSSLAVINMQKVSEGVYKGTMELMLGDFETDYNTMERTGQFNDEEGHLSAKVQGKVDGKVLTISLDDYSIKKSSQYFSNYKKGFYLFGITFDNGSYSPKAYGAMEELFDDIKINN